MPERISKVEDALAKLVVTQENSMATIRNIKIQMGQMAKQIAERQSGQFLVNNQTNPKEHCNNVVTEKEEKDETEGNKDEKERENKKSEEEKIKKKM